MKKLDVEIELIKCKIHEEDLQEEFKEKLENKLNNVCESKEYTTIEDIKNKKSFIKKPYYCYKAAAVFICFVMFSSCAFAGGVGDWLKEMFSNVSEEMEVAYENGDIKGVNTEYQTYDGVSVKVDYVSLKDNELYIVFNVKTEEYDRIYFKEFIIKDEFGNLIYDNKDDFSNEGYRENITEKHDSKTNSSVFISIIRNNDFELYKEVNIQIKNIQVIKNDDNYNYYGDWKFNIKL